MAEERPWLAVAILAGLFATSAAFWQEAARRPAEAADGLDAVRWTVWTAAAVPAAEVSPLQVDAGATDAAAGTDRWAVRVPRRTDEAAFESVGQPAVLPASAPSYRAVAVRRATVTHVVDVTGNTADHDQAVLASTRLVLSAPAAAAPDRAPVAPDTDEDGNWSDGAATATARAMSTAGKAIGKAFRIAGAKIGG